MFSPRSLRIEGNNVRLIHGLSDESVRAAAVALTALMTQCDRSSLVEGSTRVTSFHVRRDELVASASHCKSAACTGRVEECARREMLVVVGRIHYC